MAIYLTNTNGNIICSVLSKNRVRNNQQKIECFLCMEMYKTGHFFFVNSFLNNSICSAEQFGVDFYAESILHCRIRIGHDASNLN